MVGLTDAELERRARKWKAQHHIWCNLFHGDPENCWMCKELWEKYPYNGLEGEETLMKRHFPNNVRVR